MRECFSLANTFARAVQLAWPELTTWLAANSSVDRQSPVGTRQAEASQLKRAYTATTSRCNHSPLAPLMTRLADECFATVGDRKWRATRWRSSRLSENSQLMCGPHTRPVGG